MKAKTILLTLIAILAATDFVLLSCKKDEQSTNQPPTCKITSPLNGQEIVKGETVTISVDATDSDGSITEVHFIIDNIDINSTTSFPFNYNWNTSNESLGAHTLKSTSIDNIGGTTSDDITIELIEGGSTGNITDPRDGQSYAIVDIGGQIWFAENLNYETSDSWWYDNNSNNSNVYGRLYTWEAALTA